MKSEKVLKKEFSEIQKVFSTELSYKFGDDELAAIQSEDSLPGQLIQTYCKASSAETIDDNNFVQLLDFLEVLELCKNLILQSVDKEKLCNMISMLIANICFKKLSTSQEFFNLAEQLSKFLAEYPKKDLPTQELATYLSKLYSFLNISTFSSEADAGFSQFISYLRNLANLGIDAYLKQNKGEKRKIKVAWDAIIYDYLNKYAVSDEIAANGFIQLTKIYIEEQKLMAAALCFFKANNLTKLDSSKLFKLGIYLIAACELSNNCELALKLCEWLKKNLATNVEGVEAASYATTLQNKVAAILKLSNEIKEEKIHVAISSTQNSSPTKWYENISLFGKKNRSRKGLKQNVLNNELKKTNSQLSPREEEVIAQLEKLTLLQEKNQNDKIAETYNPG